MQTESKQFEALQKAFVEVHIAMGKQVGATLESYCKEHGYEVTKAAKYIKHVKLTTTSLPPYVLEYGRYEDKNFAIPILQYRIYQLPEEGKLQVGFQITTGNEPFSKITVNETESF